MHVMVAIGTKAPLLLISHGYSTGYTAVISHGYTAGTALISHGSHGYTAGTALISHGYTAGVVSHM